MKGVGIFLEDLTMRYRLYYQIVGLACLVVLFWMACEIPNQPEYGPDNPDPNPTGGSAATVTAVTPGEGYLKEDVTIQGSGFDPTPESNLVAFGDKVGTVQSASETELVVTTPNIAGETVQVRVAVKGSEFWSNEVDFTFKTALAVLAEEFPWPMGVEADDDGNVYVGSASDEVIYKIAPDGTQSVFADVPPSGSLGWGPDGYLYVAQSWENKIARVSPDGQTVEDYLEDVDTPVDFDWDQNGNMYICSNDAGFKMYDGAAVTHLADIGGGAKSCRVFGDNVYLTNIWDSQIMKFPITGTGVGEAEIVYQGDSPVGLEIDSEGTIYFTEAWETTLYAMHSDGEIEELFAEELMTPMRYLTFHGKIIYIVYPGWGDLGEVMSAYIGVEQAPNWGIQ